MMRNVIPSLSMRTHFTINLFKSVLFTVHMLTSKAHLQETNKSKAK